MEYPEFQRKIADINAMGYVQSHRKGDTEIGKTLEDFLGITENNINPKPPSWLLFSFAVWLRRLSDLRWCF